MLHRLIMVFALKQQLREFLKLTGGMIRAEHIL